MEFRKKCDFLPQEADYASRTMPLSTGARIGPLVFFGIFTAVAAVMIGFLAYAMTAFDTIMPITGLVIVCAVYLVAVGVTVSAVKRTRMLTLPAVMIKGDTIAVRYQLGYYHIHMSEIRSVTLPAAAGVTGFAACSVSFSATAAYGELFSAADRAAAASVSAGFFISFSAAAAFARTSFIFLFMGKSFLL